MNFGFRARDESRIAILSLRQPKLAKKTLFGTRTHHLGRTPSWNFSRKQIKGPPFHRRTWKWQTIKLERQESTAYLMLGYQTTLFVNWQAIKTCKVWPRASRITSPFKLKDRCPTFFYEAKLNDSLLQSCCSKSASFTNCQSKTSHNSVFDLFTGQSLSSGATIGSLNICVFNINSCAPECPSAKRKRIERENLASNRLLILYFKC